MTDPIRQAVRIRSLAEALCCFLRQDITQVYERVPANLFLRSTLRWEVEILLVVSCLIGNLTRMQILPFIYNNSSFLFVRFQAGQRSSLDSLLNFVKTKLYSQAINEKNPVHRILFIIAESTVLSSEKLTALPAKKLHDNGIEVFLLTVGKHVTNYEPNKVASKPLKTHLFRVNSFPDLPRLSKAFKGKGKLFLDSNIFVYFCVKSERILCLRSGLDEFYATFVVCKAKADFGVDINWKNVTDL